MKKIKAGIIGSGFMGTAHAEALQRIGGVEIVGVSSNDDKSLKEITSKYDIEKKYNEWKDLIEDNDIHVVHNCTPNHLHFEINKAVIKAGKHIISEKPLTVNSKQSQQLMNLLKINNVVNAINFNYRFYPLIQHVKNENEAGKLGEIYYVHGHYLQDWLYYNTDYNWRLETELSGESRAVADIGSHWCDMIQFITGQKIVKVFSNLITIHKTRMKPAAKSATFKGKELKPSKNISEVSVRTEDAGTVLFELEGGIHGVFTVSQVSAGRKNNFRFEIDGSKKAIAWDQENPNELWIGYREKANEILIKDPSLLNAKARAYAHYPGGHPEGYPDGPKNLFNNVYDFIRKGKDPQKDKTDFPTFADGHYENKIIEAVLKSSISKEWVKVK
ncbi:MAG: Gfo/Idh/MocA family oxidoreductase [Bacteroidetes bacterium]|nr:Gfo/Idh/MocA family oxidoreductase [Patescibacteria group bacterium]MBU2493505.1 Gfo/Idh/MocA family oxidoreductase [Bacteroidota bacterium]